ncbi:hypothetical protein C0992_013214 [Termitomyces sp. T32_za158]|nr:hypothetical protein C0992_013214 [Termitomyces sp. T32_za158]
MAQSHLAHGIATPFLATPRPHTHQSLHTIRAALRTIGEQITRAGVPAALGPVVIGLTGNGNVARGCLDILHELPIERVEVKHLHALVTDPNTPLNKIYLAHARPEDYLVRTDGDARPYDREDYYAHPTAYRSVFASTIAPYLTLLLNATAWRPPFPRLMTRADLPCALGLARARGLPGARMRCANVGDVSCDIAGGLEFLERATTIGEPFYGVRVVAGEGERAAAGEGEGVAGVKEANEDTATDVQIMAIDILPTTLPHDASTHFEGAAAPYLHGLIRGYTEGPLTPYSGGGGGDAVQEALERATIARAGGLVGVYDVLRPAVDEFHARAPAVARDAAAPQHHGAARKKRVLLLGSGMVARPAVEVVAARGDVQLVVAGNDRTALDALAREFPRVISKQIDVDSAHDTNTLGALIRDADVVISLLPVTHHTLIASHCLTSHTHLITASYTTPALSALHTRALASGVLILTEMGLDPGLDHLSALDVLERVKGKGEEVRGFVSFCGGLPAPEDQEQGGKGGGRTPGGYKFSWNPRGVLEAGLNGARFRLDNQIREIAPGTLFEHVFPDVPVSVAGMEGCKFEGLANRDSVKYQEAYGVPLARTFVRGTLRCVFPSFLPPPLLSFIGALRISRTRTHTDTQASQP